MAISTMVKISVLLLAVYCLSSPVSAKGAGRAFPIEAENFAIDSFQKVNSKLEWDYTNFLVDLSGQYATCKVLQKPAGLVTVDRLTPAGDTIVGVVDFTDGRGHDINSVVMYIQDIITRWSSTQLYYAQIKAADTVGCSVRPGCHGKVVVACLFTPGGGAKPRTTVRPTEKPEKNPTAAPEPLLGEQRALAFTPQQYTEAETIVGMKWDRSHYLENLSGFETDCSMVGASDWGFSYMKRVGVMLNVRLVGQFGSARNRGSTPDALRNILSKFKPLTNIREVGCSLIPHCINKQDREMYVVVSCLYEEQ